MIMIFARQWRRHLFVSESFITIFSLHDQESADQSWIILDEVFQIEF